MTGGPRPPDFMLINIPGDQFDERDDACEMDAPKLVALYVRPEFRGQGIGTELLRGLPPPQTCVREAKHVAIEQISDEGLRLLARAVPADERKRFLEYRGDEFVRSLRLALERRDRVASYVSRLERHVRRAARTPALEPGPDAGGGGGGAIARRRMWQLRADPRGARWL